MDRITVTTSGDNGEVVVSVSGDIDLLTNEEFATKLRSALTSPNHVVVLDLSGVRFLGSAALSVLVSSAEEARSADVDLRLVANERIVLRPLEIAGINQTLSVFDSVDAALAAGGPR